MWLDFSAIGLGVDFDEVIVGELDAVNLEADAHAAAGVLHDLGELLWGEAVAGRPER